MTEARLLHPIHGQGQTNDRRRHGLDDGEGRVFPGMRTRIGPGADSAHAAVRGGNRTREVFARSLLNLDHGGGSRVAWTDLSSIMGWARLCFPLTGAFHGRPVAATPDRECPCRVIQARPRDGRLASEPGFGAGRRTTHGRL